MGLGENGGPLFCVKLSFNSLSNKHRAFISRLIPFGLIPFLNVESPKDKNHSLYLLSCTWANFSENKNQTQIHCAC